MPGTEARRLALGCALTVVIAVGASEPASGSELRIGDRSQSPEVVYSQAISHDGPACLLDVVDGAWSFPAPLAVPPGPHRARILYSRVARPERAEVVASYAVDRLGRPTGPSNRLPVALKPVRGAGRPAGWQLAFDLNPPPTYYLVVSVTWPPDPGCGLTSFSRVAYSVSG